MKVRKLCSAILESYDSEADCARSLGWPRQRLNKITHGKKEPNVVEINELSIALNRSIEDIVGFFLAYKSTNGQQQEA